MILLAESGSTKTDWILFDDIETASLDKTAGYNPDFQSEDEIKNSLKKELLPQLEGVELTQVFFYGASCFEEFRKNKVKRSFLHFFPRAKVVVEHDILGAARSVCQGNPGIACILGTGSNSCLYDGVDIIDNIEALGFILGDEGSGAHMGKLLIKKLFTRKLNPTIVEKLQKFTDVDKSTIISKVYSSDFPSRYLANFSKFIKENIEQEEIESIVIEAFEDFITSRVLGYKNHRSYPLNFIGSIAHHFEEQLTQVVKKHECIMGKIIQSPIEQLLQYHKERYHAENN